MLKNVTTQVEKEQLIGFTCFIIHVGTLCIGEKAYA